MKLLAVRLARSIWLLPQYFLNPKGIYLRPALPLLKERYGFQNGPGDSSKPNDSEGLKFENGFFQSKNGNIAIVSLTLHADGIVADTRSSTEDGDAFIADALSFVSKEFGLPPAKDLPFKKVYASELNVVYPKTPHFLNPALKPFFDALRPHVTDDRSSKADFIGFIFGPDQSLSEKPAFRLEREIKTPFEQNRYFSFAPFQTSKHIHLLEELEKVA